jgi:N-acyl amino acid synthase of PEP-CTERM/exosortase system
MPSSTPQFGHTASVTPSTDAKRESRLMDIYNGYFETVLAETDQQREAAFRLRYEVYCVEHPFEDPAANPNGMEIDAYDRDAVHALLVHKENREVCGTVRLILPCDPAKGDMPIRHICRHDLILSDNDTLPRACTAEISRFAVSKKFRRRANEETMVGTIYGKGDDKGDSRRRIPNTSLGLMQAIVAMSAKSGVTHVCAVMEPMLLRMLGRLGIHFYPLGPIVDYHGRRQPCYSDLDLLLTRTWLERRDVWEILTCDGSLWPLNEERADFLRPNTRPREAPSFAFVAAE